MSRHVLQVRFELEYPTANGARYRILDETHTGGVVLGVICLHKAWLLHIGHDLIPEFFDATILLPEPETKEARIAKGGVKLHQHTTTIDPIDEPGTVRVNGEVIYTPLKGHIKTAFDVAPQEPKAPPGLVERIRNKIRKA